MVAWDEAVIDGLQYCNWSAKIFDEMRQARVIAVHATVAYHETFREAVANIVAWRRLFARYPDRITAGRSAHDIRRAAAEGRTAIFFGSQNPSVIEDDIGLVEILHDLGLRFMQLSYNNQSLLAAGCYEAEDAGISRMGQEVIAEMNRLGMIIDMSHSGEKSTLQAIALSSRPIAITHANPFEWAPVTRNKSESVLQALAQSHGLLGLSLYPLHLRGESACTLPSFCAMAARTAETMGVEHIAIGSDLCQDQPGPVLQWMRTGRWSKRASPGARFPPAPQWFASNLGFIGLRQGLRAVGFSQSDLRRILCDNWLEFLDQALPTSRPGDD
jgi:microsomal dipeptidase-like Zn-dependent dipeptidase